MAMRYSIRNVSITHPTFQLDTNCEMTAMLMAGLGLYVWDERECRQIVSNDPRVVHFTPRDPVRRV